MGVKLVRALPGDICAQDMKDGEIGVITRWVYNDVIGHIVQRRNDSLISVGHTEDCDWNNLLASGQIREDCRVRLLQPGETLEIT